MLVYGDPVRVEDPRAMLARIATAWREAARMPAGVARHARLVAALIEAGMLAQGLADLAFAARGKVDDLELGDRARMNLCAALARAVMASWDGGFAEIAPVDEAALAASAAGELPARLTAKIPEGYAFYGLYPEAVLAAARALPPVPRTRVVGIRSIGTGLAAIAAAALGDPAPVTLRPTGDPFRRAVRLSPAMARHLTHGIDRVVVVDEGPGLSGSSFGAVADALEALGLERARIAFLPSHGGDLGPQASEAHRTRWARAARPVVDFDTLILSCEKPAHNLGHWIETLVGPLESPLQEISGGAWRAIAYGNDERSWPAVAAHQERRKFFARSGGAAYLIKFAGLGPIGERLAERAAALGDAAFIPPTAGFVHGFLVQRWREDLRPLDLARVDRAALIAHLARYLAFRARRFPAAIESGASGEALLAMVARNVGLDLGEPAGEAAARRLAGLPELDAGLRRIETDNRPQAHEWLVDPAGRLWKADAVDHHAAHDLIGCQDLAWDITGARIELDLSEGEVEALCAAIEAEGAPVDRARLAMLPVAYLAFHLGRARMAADALAGWPAEAARLSREAERYRLGLQALLA